jgi:predicted dehydrogenase
MSKRLRAGVVGAGVFGGYHSGKYAEAENRGAVDFIGVYDLDPTRSALIAEKHGVKAFGAAGLDAFLREIDILTIATPAFAHAGVALKALAAGVHVYTEKPLAISLEDASRMVDLAQANGLILACGHQERCVFEAMGLYNVPEKPVFLEAVRNGLEATRNLDVSVTLDLMIHDLDLAISLAGAEASAVEATGRKLIKADYTATGSDEVEARVDFDSGFKAVFKASRMAEARERRMRLVYPSGEVNVDFLTRRFENTTPFALNADFAEAEIARDPLGTSVYRFIAAVEGRITRPLCTGDEAMMALEVALAIDEALD